MIRATVIQFGKNDKEKKGDKMALWKIEPAWKKSLVERNHYHKDGKEIVVETGWRWGSFTCETEDDTPPVIESGENLFECAYEVEMQETFDGCWEDYEYNGMTEEEIVEVQNFIDENSYFDLEELGWSCGDTEMIIDGDVSIEKIEE
jgi:hypothetical protein